MARGFSVLSGIWKRFPALICTGEAAIIFISDLAVGTFFGRIRLLTHQTRRMTFEKIVKYGIEFWPLTLILAGGVTFLVYKGLARFYKDYSSDDEINTEISERGDAGTAARMHDGPEKASTFESHTIFDTTDLITGIDVDHPEAFLTRKKIKFVNDNEMYIGAAGTGKTVGKVIPIIEQIIFQGQSAYITDSKSYLFGLFKFVAENRGYIVKCLNFDIEGMLHSDSINLFKYMTENRNKISTYANTVIENLNDDAADFFPKASKNLLMAVMEYIASDLNTEFERTLKGMVTFIAQDATTVYNALKQAPEGSTCRMHADIWWRMPDNAKTSAHSGLGIDLSDLVNELTSVVLGTDDIDLFLPGDEKCLYFINLPDQNNNNVYLSALFFDILYEGLAAKADKSPSHHLKKTVTVLYEEFANIGKIPNYSKKISTIRSRGVNSIMILQNKVQLEANYGDEGESIMDACSTIGLLGTNSESTAKWFNERAGQMSIVSDRESYATSKDALIKAPNDIKESQSVTGRDTYFLDEVYRLHKEDCMLIVISGRNPIKVKKFNYWQHPLTKEIVEIEASKYMPKWAKEMDAEEMRLRYGIIKDEEYIDYKRPIIEECTDDDFEMYNVETAQYCHQVEVINEDTGELEKKYDVNKYDDVPHYEEEAS